MIVAAGWPGGDLYPYWPADGTMHHGCWRDIHDAGSRKSATLSFLRTELLYDVANYAYVEADIMDDKQEHAKHQTFDVAEDGNVDRVTRMLTLAHAECVEYLYPYTKRMSEKVETRVDLLDNVDEYIIEMDLPKEFSKSTLDLLEWYIHEYMVCRVLYDWFLITKPEAAGAWKTRMDAAKEGIDLIKNKRTGMVRRKQHPFP